MTDIIEDFNTTIAHPGESDLEQIRENWRWLFLCILLAGVRDLKKCVYAPGWTTTVTSNESPADYDHPDQITVTKSPYTYQFDLTWTGDNLTTIECGFGDGTTTPDVETITNGTITCTYDASGNLTGATTA